MIYDDIDIPRNNENKIWLCPFSSKTCIFLPFMQIWQSQIMSIFFLKQGAIIETQQKQTSITVNTAH